LSCWLRTTILLISASWVASIIGVSYRHQHPPPLDISISDFWPPSCETNISCCLKLLGLWQFSWQL
jgi:hypothetical protein